MPLRKEPIPWRLPYIGPAKEYALREHKLVITPVTSWLNVIEPGDPVELIHPNTMTFLSYGGVCYIKKSYIGFLSPIEVDIWLPGATRRVLIDLLSDGYGIKLNLKSLVSVIALIHCDRPEDAPSCLDEVMINWSRSANMYFNNFVKRVMGKEEY